MIELKNDEGLKICVRKDAIILVKAHKKDLNKCKITIRDKVYLVNETYKYVTSLLND